jgi:hypothetical protein
MGGRQCKVGRVCWVQRQITGQSGVVWGRVNKRLVLDNAVDIDGQGGGSMRGAHGIPCTVEDMISKNGVSTYLEQLLQDVVAEHVSHEEMSRGDDLIEDQLFVHIRAHL